MPEDFQEIGGIPEETTTSECLTPRENTQRQIPVEIGNNTLLGCDPSNQVARGTLRCQFLQQRTILLLFIPRVVLRVSSTSCASRTIRG